MTSILQLADDERKRRNESADPTTKCWCGMTLPDGTLHYPGNDPESGPAHRPGPGCPDCGGEAHAGNPACVEDDAGLPDDDDDTECPRCGARFAEDPSCGKTVHLTLPPRPPLTPAEIAEERSIARGEALMQDPDVEEDI